MHNSPYRRENRKRAYKFDETKDDLKRGMTVMIDYLQWIMWFTMVIAILLVSGFLGLVFYFLATGRLF